MDLARHPEKAKPTTQKLRPKDRPLANDFVSDEEFDDAPCVVRQHRARAAARPRVLHLGRVRQLRQLPAGTEGRASCTSRQAIIWVKEHPVLTRKDFMGNHEWCFYGWREGAAHQFFGPNNADGRVAVKKVNPQSMVHLTEKPVELAVRAMQYSSRAGRERLDLFGGAAAR